MQRISIIGAGSHTRSSINLLKQNYKDTVFEIYDDSYDVSVNESIDNVKMVGRIQDLKSDTLIFLSLGDNKKRERYFYKYQNQLLKDNLIHSTSVLENNLIIGTSNQIFANVYINAYAEIGNNNIINTAAILEHEVKIGSHNHISVGAKLCGRAMIGNSCMIGAGAIVIDKICICDDVVVGAGAVVIKDIVQSGTYVGNPARKVK